MAGEEMVYGLTPKRAAVSTSSDNASLVAAVTGKSIRVTAFFLTISGAGDIAFQSGGSTALTGLLQGVADGNQFVGQYNPDGWAQSVVSEALTLDNPSTLTVTGMITYVEV